MLMFTMAEIAAKELAASHGVTCSPVSYHGNVGHGMSLKEIHKIMMTEKGRSKLNIMSPVFDSVGIGLYKGSDGLIYLCQLFK